MKIKDTAQIKIIKKIETRWYRYDKKLSAVKRNHSVRLWLRRKEAASALSLLAENLLAPHYSMRKCESILRKLYTATATSDTPGSKALTYVLDDIL